MTDKDREHLIGNIVAHLGNAQKRIQLRQTALFFKADPDYGRRVAQGLGLERQGSRTSGGNVPRRASQSYSLTLSALAR